MGLWRKVQAFWKADVMLESTVELMQREFADARRRFPERDCHHWLVCCLWFRPGYRPRDAEGLAECLGYTLPASMYGPEEAPMMLGHHLVWLEQPRLRSRMVPFYRAMLEPVAQLLSQGEERFVDEWARRNPWTAPNPKCATGS